MRSTLPTIVLPVFFSALACSRQGEQPSAQSAQIQGSYGQQTAVGTGIGQGGYGQQMAGPGTYGQPIGAGGLSQLAAGGGPGIASSAAGGQPSVLATGAGAAPGQQASPPASGAAAAPNPLGAILSNPQALQQIVTGVLSASAAQMGAWTGGELGPIKQGIKMKAAQVAPGMKPVGQLMSAKCAQGQHAQAPIQLQSGVCYTVVGFAGLGVFKYQLNLLTQAPPGGQPQVLAQSPDNASDPVLGPKEQCVRVPLSMAVVLDMNVVMGQGLVGAQLYQK